MIDFSIIPDSGEPYKVTATARDVLVWERANRNGKVFRDISENQSMVDLYHLAWLASRRLGHIEGSVTLGDFERGYELETAEGEQAEADPTRSDPSVGS